MVEEHEIDESEDEVSLTITGRSVTAFFLENRIGSINAFSSNSPTTPFAAFEYLIGPASLSTNLTQYLREQLIDAVSFLNGQDVIPSMNVTALFDSGGTAAETVFKRGEFQTEVTEKLEQLDAGLKFERSISGISNLYIHKGIDVSDNVQFSADFGDLKDTRYFWSISNYRNSALVVGKFSSTVIRPATLSGFDLRVMYVNATDYEFNPSVSGSTADFNKATRILKQRGEQALGNQRKTQFLETNINPTNRYQYRRDYNIGDIVFVRGNYDVSQKMRIVEFAEFEDETGEVGVPTVKPLAS